jgi:hypothetical protein
MKLGGSNIEPPTARQVAAWIRYQEALLTSEVVFASNAEQRYWEVARIEAGLEIGEVLLQVITNEEVLHEEDSSSSTVQG